MIWNHPIETTIYKWLFGSQAEIKSRLFWIFFILQLNHFNQELACLIKYIHYLPFPSTCFFTPNQLIKGNFLLFVNPQKIGTKIEAQRKKQKTTVISQGDLARPPPFSGSDPNEQRSKPVADIPLNPDWFIFRDPYFRAEMK